MLFYFPHLVFTYLNHIFHKNKTAFFNLHLVYFVPLNLFAVVVAVPLNVLVWGSGQEVSVS